MDIKPIIERNIENKWLIFLINLIFLYLAYPVWYKFYEDFDPSFKLAITESVFNNYNFGIDISPGTYGPLGFLTNRLPTAAIFWPTIIFDILITYAIIQIVFIFNNHKKLTLLSTFLILINLYNISFQYDTYIVVLPLFILYIYTQPQFKESLFLQIFTVLLAVLSFFIKSNFGLFVIPFTLAGNIILTNFNLKNNAIGCIVGLVALLTLSEILNVHLPTMLEHTFYHLSGYNEAMALFPEVRNMQYLSKLIVFLQISISFYFLYLIIKLTSFPQKFIILITLAYSFILFKSSVVRADQIHLTYYLSFIALFVLIVEPINHKTVFIKPIATTLGLIGFIVFGVRQIGQNNTKIYRFQEYFSSFYSNHQEIKNTIIRKHPSLTETLKAQISANRSITCIPFNYSVANLESKYKPLNIPTIQSLYNYNSFLDSINSDFFEAQKADFIIEHLQTENLLQAAYLENNSFIERKLAYAPLSFDKNYLLLNRRKIPVNLITKRIFYQKPIHPQSSNIVLFNFNPQKTYRIQFKFNSSLYKSLLTTLYKFENPKIEVTTRDTSLSGSIAFSILKRGFIIQPIPSNTSELEALYSIQPVQHANSIQKIAIDFSNSSISDVSYSIEELVFKP